MKLNTLSSSSHSIVPVHTDDEAACSNAGHAVTDIWGND